MSTDSGYDDLEELEALLDDDEEDVDAASLQAELVALEAENERLRREYAQAQQVRYRRTAFGLLAIGVVAIGGGLLFPESQPVLFALGGTGLFAGLLTLYLTPEQFIPADVGERVYAALAANERALVADLGLSEHRVYLPATATAEESVQLFVPQQAEYALPDTIEDTSVFVVTENARERGVLFGPTGEALYQEFEYATADIAADTPGLLADQLVDALVEQFELIDRGRVEVDLTEGQARIGISGSVYGAVDQFDHPVPSLIAVGLVRGLDQAVQVQVTDSDDDRIDALVTITWEAAETDTATETESATEE